MRTSFSPFLLAEIYDSGFKPVMQDSHKARELYLKAARLGYLDAIYNYANMCAQGVGGKIDLTTAFKWYKIADQRGQIRATTNLAALYEEGTGCLKNIELAAKLFKKAADAGQGNAMSRLAKLYLAGHGVKQSYKIARELFKKSSETPSVAQQDSIERLATMDNGCSFCFTPLELKNTTTVGTVYLSNSVSMSVSVSKSGQNLKKGATRNCKCKVARYCDDICT